MHWKVSNTTTRLYLLFILCSTIIGCKKTDIAFGTEFIDNDYTQIVKVDTFSVTTSTINIDSFTTSAKGVCLMGNLTDTYFGQISAKSFLRIQPEDYTDIFDDTQFDSISLIGKVSSNYAGDTSFAVPLNIYRVAQDINLETNNTAFYNTSSFTTFSTPIGSSNIYVRPVRGDSFRVKINNSLGQEWFAMLQRKSDTVKTSTVFIDYFKGIQLNSPTTQLLFSCKDSVAIRIYYTKKGLFNTNKTFDFVISSPSYQFNHIQSNKAGTDLQSINNNNYEIYSTQTNNRSYVFPLAGVMTKLRFPTVRELLKIPNFKQLLKANLLIRPISGSFNNNNPLPTQIRLARTTQLNAIGTDITSLSSSGSTVTQYGDLTIDQLYGKNTYYSYDVTSYVSEVIATEGYTQNGLLVIPPSNDYETSFKRLVMGNRQNSLGNIELQIYFITVQ